MRFTRERTLAAAAMLLAVVTLCAGCKKAAVDPFPPTGSVAGWEKTGETRTFAPKDLYQYIDGDAEQYVAAGVATTSTADYKFQGGLEATVDVHTMSDAAGATKIFAKDQSGDGKSITIGDAGLSHAQSVVFRKGPYLVRIVAFQSAPGAADALLALAHAVEVKL
jgi:uncharacterized protein DUF6599